MRVAILCQEEPVFLGPFVREVVRLRPGAVCAVVVAGSRSAGERRGCPRARLEAFRTFWLLFETRGFVDAAWRRARRACLGPHDPTSVERLARSLGIPVQRMAARASAQLGRVIERLGADVVLNQSEILLKPDVLAIPRVGFVNRHGSLLPAHRGRMAAFWAHAAEPPSYGVTIHLVDEGIDTGPILLQRDCPIGSEETAGEVEKRLSEMGAVLLVETLRGLAAGEITPRPQEIDRETYAPKIRPETARIPWEREAVSIANLVRAMSPRPGAATSLGSGHLKIWRVAVGPPRSGDEMVVAPGTVLPGGSFPRVACGGGGSIVLLELQKEGRGRVSGGEALRGRWLGPGDRFGEATQAGGE